MTLRNKLYAASAAFIAAPVMMLAQEQTTGAPVTAQGTGWATTFDVADNISSVQSVADGMETMFTNILSMLIKPIGLVLLAGIAIWAAPHIVGIIKSAFNRGKGR